jgi:hypothetical protein
MQYSLKHAAKDEKFSIRDGFTEMTCVQEAVPPLNVTFVGTIGKSRVIRPGCMESPAFKLSWEPILRGKEGTGMSLPGQALELDLKDFLVDDFIYRTRTECACLRRFLGPDGVEGLWELPPLLRFTALPAFESNA